MMVILPTSPQDPKLTAPLTRELILSLENKKAIVLIAKENLIQIQ
jgi:hypothetical protein